MRYYTVQHQRNDKVVTPLFFVKAPSPKRAVLKVAAQLSPWSESWSQFRVVPLRSGKKITDHSGYVYDVSMKREAHGAFRNP